MASYAHLRGQVDAFFTKSAGQTDSAALRSEASGLVEAAVSAAGQEILKGQRGDEHGYSAAKLFFELALRLDATNQAARSGVEKAHAALNAVGLQITIPRTQLVADGRGGGTTTAYEVNVTVGFSKWSGAPLPAPPCALGWLGVWQWGR